MGSCSSPSDFPSAFKPILYTSRLTLTIFDENKPDHCDHIIACFQDPIALERMGDMGIRTHEQLKALGKNMILSPSFCGGKVPHGMACYNIHLGSSPLDPMIGLISLAQRSKTVPPDVGWGVLHQYAGNGYATEAGREVFRYMTEEYGVTEMVALIKPTNLMSIRVAEKIGFVEPGEIITEEGGLPKLIYTLKGMKKIDPNTRINFYGDGEEGERIKKMMIGASGH
ncbi:hypothetical protein MMC17_000030 [Xylographa soralifera]|nr:hypothetical protein [Xylographa soralifera]